jgi:hypothetical protein
LALAECICPLLTVEQLADATAFLLGLGGQGADRAESERRRREIERHRDARDVTSVPPHEREP